MRPNSKRFVTIALILVIAILLGVLTNFIWNFIENISHPQTYNELIEKYSALYGVPEELVYAIIKVESDFDPNAVSGAGAIGLMQMLPSTFKWLTGKEHLREYLDPLRLTDPDVSIKYGTYYIKYLLDKFPTENAAIAAYNAGEGNVADWLKDRKYSDARGNLTDIPFSETRSYIEKINKEKEKYIKLYNDKEI